MDRHSANKGFCHFLFAGRQPVLRFAKQTEKTMSWGNLMSSSFLTATARTLAALFFSLFLIACDPPPGDRHYVTADVLNVRNIPQTGKVVAQLRHGDSVYIVEIKNGWGRLSDKSVWVIQRDRDVRVT